MQYLVFASPVLLVLGIILPRWTIAAALGFLLPIDVVGTFSPTTLDMLRYGLAGLLVARSFDARRVVAPLSLPARISVACLLVVYILGTLKSLFAAGSGIASLVPLVGLVSLLIAVWLSREFSIRRPILIGFVLGSSASATDILLQAWGLPYLGTPSLWGTRYAGLSFSSTNTAPFIALALVLTVTPWIWRESNRNYRTAEVLCRISLAVVLAAALLLSGGRGGVIGFILAIILFVLHSVRNRAGVAVLALAVVPAGIAANWELLVNFVDRGGRAEDITSGRVERNALAWEVLNQNWLFGIPYSDSSSYNPHTPILLFGLQVGFIGAIATLIVTIVLLWIAVIGVASNRFEVTLAMLAIIMFTTALLEPLGFYIGLAKTTLLLIVLASVANKAPPARASTRSEEKSESVSVRGMRQ